MHNRSKIFASLFLTAVLALGCSPSNQKVKAATNKIVVGADAPTISDAIDMAVSGDTIVVPAGNYIEQLYIETDGISIIGEDGAILDGSTITPNSRESSMICVNASDVSISNLEIKEFKLDGPSTSIVPIGIEVDGGSSNITISHCKIHDMGCIYKSDSDAYNAHGILVSAPVDEPIDGITIDGCELYNLSLGNSESLAINGNVSNFIVSNNYIHNCDNIGIDAIGYEQSEEYDEADRARNGEIVSNIVEYISSDPEVNVTYDDKCAGGIYVDGARDIEIYGNSVSFCDIGIEVASEHVGTFVTGINVHDNELKNNNAFAGISFGGYDVSNTGSATSCAFKNNIITNTAGACFKVQYACNSSNIISDNVFDAQGTAVKYQEMYGEYSAGNTVVGNN
ncbi:right-handed parallel beta-helix repeat-containing protein [Pseudobutyrivibrio sp.]|uniref:right-handed parallel beta-helix repeat-containing protein n=1 Tax=Pseudobutyrivibrio sp. TaxID=2014367 RepID=UPI00386CFB1F